MKVKVYGTAPGEVLLTVKFSPAAIKVVEALMLDHHHDPDDKDAWLHNEGRARRRREGRWRDEARAGPEACPKPASEA